MFGGSCLLIKRLVDGGSDVRLWNSRGVVLRISQSRNLDWMRIPESFAFSLGEFLSGKFIRIDIATAGGAVGALSSYRDADREAPSFDFFCESFCHWSSLSRSRGHDQTKQAPNESAKPYSVAANAIRRHEGFFSSVYFRF